MPVDARAVLVHSSISRPQRHQTNTHQDQGRSLVSRAYMVQDAGPRQDHQFPPTGHRPALPLVASDLAHHGLVLASRHGPIRSRLPVASSNDCPVFGPSSDMTPPMLCRLMNLLTDDQGFHLICSTPHFWTHHSARNFLPSATAALGFEKADGFPWRMGG